MSDLRTIPVHAAEPAQNGEMLSRVKQLRLDNQLNGAKSGGGGATWLPWILCVVLAVTWAGVAIRSYKNGPQSDSVLATSPANGTNTTGTTRNSTTSNTTCRAPSTTDGIHFGTWVVPPGPKIAGTMFETHPPA